LMFALDKRQKRRALLPASAPRPVSKAGLIRPGEAGPTRRAFRPDSAPLPASEVRRKARFPRYALLLSQPLWAAWNKLPGPCVEPAARARETRLVALMSETRTGSEFADEAITHLDSLYRGALRLTRNPEQAQDLVQDTYVRALRYQHSFEAGTNMKAWLFAIMRNLFWDRFKSLHKDDVSLDEVGEFPLYDKLKDSAEIPEAEVLDKLAAG